MFCHNILKIHGYIKHYSTKAYSTQKSRKSLEPLCSDDTKIGNTAITSLLQQLRGLVSGVTQKDSRQRKQSLDCVHEKILATLIQLNENNVLKRLPDHNPRHLAAAVPEYESAHSELNRDDTSGNSVEAKSKLEEHFCHEYIDIIRTVYSVYPSFRFGNNQTAEQEKYGLDHEGSVLYNNYDKQYDYNTNNRMLQYIEDINNLVFTRPSNYCSKSINLELRDVSPSTKFGDKHNINGMTDCLEHLGYNKFISDAGISEVFPLLLQIILVDSKFDGYIVKRYSYVSSLISKLISDVRYSVEQFNESNCSGCVLNYHVSHSGGLQIAKCDSGVFREDNGVTIKHVDISYNINRLWALVRNMKWTHSNKILFADAASILVDVVSRSKQECVTDLRYSIPFLYNSGEVTEEGYGLQSTRGSIYPPILVELLTVLNVSQAYNVQLCAKLCSYLCSVLHMYRTATEAQVRPHSYSDATTGPLDDEHKSVLPTVLTDRHASSLPRATSVSSFQYLWKAEPSTLGVDSTTIRFLDYVFSCSFNNGQNSVASADAFFDGLINDISYSFAYHVHDGLRCEPYMWGYSGSIYPNGDEGMECCTLLLKFLNQDINNLNRMICHIYNGTSRFWRIDENCIIADRMLYVDMAIALELLYRRYILPNLDMLSLDQIMPVCALRTVLLPTLHSPPFELKGDEEVQESQRGLQPIDNIFSTFQNNDSVVRIIDISFPFGNKGTIVEYLVLLSHVSPHLYTAYDTSALPHYLLSHYAYYGDSIASIYSCSNMWSCTTSFNSKLKSKSVVKDRRCAQERLRGIRQASHVCRRILESVQTLSHCSITFCSHETSQVAVNSRWSGSCLISLDNVSDTQNQATMFPQLQSRTRSGLNISILLIPSLVRTIASAFVYLDSISLHSCTIKRAMYTDLLFHVARYNCPPNLLQTSKREHLRDTTISIGELNRVDNISHLCEQMWFLGIASSCNEDAKKEGKVTADEIIANGSLRQFGLYHHLLLKTLYIIYKDHSNRDVSDGHNLSSDNSCRNSSDILFMDNMEPDIFDVLHSFITGNPPRQIYDRASLNNVFARYFREPACFFSNAGLESINKARYLEFWKNTSDNVIFENYVCVLRILWSIVVSVAVVEDRIPDKIISDVFCFVTTYNNKVLKRYKSDSTVIYGDSQNQGNLSKGLRHYESAALGFDPDIYDAKKVFRKYKRCHGPSEELFREYSCVIGSTYVWAGGIVRPTEMLRQLVLVYNLQMIVERFDIKKASNKNTEHSRDATVGELIVAIKDTVLFNDLLKALPLTVAYNTQKFHSVCNSVKRLTNKQFSLSLIRRRIARCSAGSNGPKFVERILLPLVNLHSSKEVRQDDDCNDILDGFLEQRPHMRRNAVDHMGIQPSHANLKANYERYVEAVLQVNLKTLKSYIRQNPVVFPHMVVLKRNVISKAGIPDLLLDHSEKCADHSPLETAPWQVEALVHIVPKHRNVISKLYDSHRKDFDFDDCTYSYIENNSGLSGLDLGNIKACSAWNKINFYLTHIIEKLDEVKQQELSTIWDEKITKIYTIFCSHKMTHKETDRILKKLFEL